MKNIINVISNNLIQIVFMIITGIVSYLGLRIKNIYEEYITTKIKKEIVERTVFYVEQTCKNLTCIEKKREAKEKSLKWLKEKNISISDTEIEILIESAVKCL